MRSGSSRWVPLFLLTVLAVTPALAATDVRCMPDRQVLDGSTLPVFGAACTGGGCVPGDASANGESSAWSFTTVNVMVTDDGDLTDGGGGLLDDHYIKEDVTLTLLAGTREMITATLDVGGTMCSVNIDVVSPADVIYATPADALLVDVNIAIEDGLRYLYLNQQANGSWLGGQAAVAYTVTNTGLAVWAFNNSGHPPATGTIYSPSSQAGLDYLFGTTSTVVNIAGHAGSDFNAHLGADEGINPTGPIGTADEDYSAGFAIGAIISTIAPGTVIAAGPAAGLTYKQYVEEFTDWAAYGQTPIGGWNYQSSSFGGNSTDNSINSWMYIGLEGAESVFGSSFNPRLKDTIYTSLVSTQEDTVADANFGRFGYRNMTPVRGNVGYATSCAGLSGLALEELPANKSAGTPDYSAGPAELDTFAEKEAAVLAHLGRNWARNALGAEWLKGNHGNHYAMWTCCRSLRIAGVSSLNNDGTFGGAVGPFSWEKNIAAGGDTVTGGYWPSLVGSQQADGRWATTSAGAEFFELQDVYGSIFDTAVAVLCLQPTVFGFCGDGVVTPPEQCDPPGPACDAGCQILGEICDNGVDDDGDGLVDAEDVEDCEPLLVVLESFKAEATRQGVELSWRTSIEIDTAGFRILRGKDDGRELVSIGDLIPARGTEVSGADYELVDSSRQKRGTVFYWLEDIDVNGKVTRHGPVAVQLELPIVGRPDAARPRPSRKGNR